MSADAIRDTKAPWRVLDLCDQTGDFAGYLLAKLGGAVVAARLADGVATARPMIWPSRERRWVYQQGKEEFVAKSVEELETLGASVDVVVDCGLSGIDLARLRERNPALITVSISPFGQGGPKSDLPATDLTITAASGLMSLLGDDDRPPLRMGQEQTWLHGGANAASAVMIALHERDGSGLGQHIDVSTQESMLVCTQHAMMSGLLGNQSPGRIAGGMRFSNYVLRAVYKCRDGYTTCSFVFGHAFAHFAERLMEWAFEEGLIDYKTRHRDWVNFGADLSEGREPLSELEKCYTAIERLFATKTKSELMEAAVARKLMIAPANEAPDILSFEQLAERSFWKTASFDGKSIKVPDQLAVVHRNSAGPAAPAAVSRRERQPGTKAPLAGVRVLDFTWAIAAPLGVRLLAEHGAEVFRIESQTRPDSVRAGFPRRGAEGDPEGSFHWHSANANKMHLTLDLSNPQARDVILDLARSCDVVTESFSPGVLDKLGLGWDELSKVNPALVMLSSSLLGRGGRFSKIAGVGTMGAALSGFYQTVGWPDRPPAGPWLAYSDYTAPRITASLILAALRERDITGIGQYIDVSQVEAAVHFFGQALVDAQASGLVAGPEGNDNKVMAPHGVYPLAGEEHWIAIACDTDRGWRRLAALLGCLDLEALSLAERLEQRRLLDDRVIQWTSSLSRQQVEEALTRIEVPHHFVARALDCVDDPQLIARDHFLRLPHELYGHTWVEQCGFRLSRTPAQINWAGPTFGKHNEKILSEVLGYEPERVTDLILAGVIE